MDAIQNSYIVKAVKQEDMDFVQLQDENGVVIFRIPWEESPEIRDVMGRKSIRYIRIHWDSPEELVIEGPAERQAW